MGFSSFYGAEKVLNFDSVIWVGTLFVMNIFYLNLLPYCPIQSIYNQSTHPFNYSTFLFTRTFGSLIALILQFIFICFLVSST